MRRTNVYLDDEQLTALRQLATEENVSVADLVRRAVDSYILPRLCERNWQRRFEKLIVRIRERAAKTGWDELEEDITAAREEVRLQHQSRRALHWIPRFHPG